MLDPLLTHMPSRGPGGVLRDGSLAGRVSEALFKGWGVSPTLVRSLRAIRPVLLHAHTGVSGARALPLTQQLRIPLVVTFHGYDITAPDEEMRQWRFRGRVFLRRREALKRETRLIITVSQFIRAQLLERGWPEAKVVVHYIGIDTEFFHPDPAVVREPVVLYVGRLIECKVGTYLITTIHEVQARVPTVQLVIAGTGDRQSRLDRQARELGVRIRFLGATSAQEVRG